MRNAIAGLMLCASGLVLAADDVQLLGENELGAAWLADTSHAPRLPYPVELLREGIGGCVAVAALIGADGRVTPRGAIVVQTNAKKDRQYTLLEQTAIDAVAARRFAPAPANAARLPTLTYLTMTYAVEGERRPVDHGVLKGLCAIADFPATVKAKLDAAPRS